MDSLDATLAVVSMMLCTVFVAVFMDQNGRMDFSGIALAMVSILISTVIFFETVRSFVVQCVENIPSFVVQCVEITAMIIVKFFGAAWSFVVLCVENIPSFVVKCVVVTRFSIVMIFSFVIQCVEIIPSFVVQCVEIIPWEGIGKGVIGFAKVLGCFLLAASVFVYLRYGSFIKMVLQEMTDHHRDAYHQKLGCFALWFLAFNDDNQIIIGKNGGIEVILLAMRTHMSVVNVQRQGCRALWKLGSANTDNRIKIVRLGGIEVIQRARATHLRDDALNRLGRTTCMLTR